MARLESDVETRRPGPSLAPFAFSRHRLLLPAVPCTLVFEFTASILVPTTCLLPEHAWPAFPRYSLAHPAPLSIAFIDYPSWILWTPGRLENAVPASTAAPDMPI